MPRVLAPNRPISSSPTQNAQVQADIQYLQDIGATNIRVNQQQLTVRNGQRVGTNRPDLQFVSNDGGRWVFGQSGEPWPFEKLERYQARKVRERFTFDMLEEDLRHLGLSPFQEDFYLPQGAPAWLVEKTGPVVATQKEYTLAQARDDL